MKFATFNTNSVRLRLPVILEWLLREQPDILCLQEIKAQDKDFPAADFEGAGFHPAFKGQKSYNGVAIISRQMPQEVKTSLTSIEDQEARFISATILDVPVINVYIPQGMAPGTDKFAYKLRWLRGLLAHIKENYKKEMPLLIAGDFNVALETIDVFDPESFRDEAGFHPDEQAIMQELLAWGLVDIFRKHQPDGGHYTFWDYRIPNALKRNMGWRIDYILATQPLADKSVISWIDTGARALPKPSDHTFLIAEFDMS
ncbi:Exodeoxyribonuclease III [uncultured Desulfobacterium sp.]|uniref:Exodeoxyribonuclease III n=1 Tax=uncultured Desulfobacterium sp. TaxID=201089 RepID=A0A445MW45_9BACT|nr:Exodeoxyribonuclease III [uncultured Desulfobacterium sp.]